MKICVAQTKPVKGDIQSNIAGHKKLIALAVADGAEIIIFPELSITGYEPELAQELAIHKDDSRLDDFQKISDTDQITIGVGAPLKNDTGITISMILFRPQRDREVYSKKYIHADEEGFFVSGQSSVCLSNNEPNIAFAICYELSVPEHAENAFKNGAQIYIASAVKSVNGIGKAIQRLSDIASNYSMTVLLSNCIGLSGGYDCAGKTSAWNNKGILTGQLNDKNEGILIIDTETENLFQKMV